MRRTRDNDSRLRVVTLARDAGSGYGGAERVAYEFARRLDPARFASYLVTTRAPAPLRAESVVRDRRELAERSVQVLGLGRTSSWSLMPWRKLYRLLADESIDIVHAHMPRASVPGSILARLARVPVVISHEHGSLLTGKIARPLLDRHVVGRLSTTILAVSDWDRRQVIEREHLPPERVDVFPNGIEPLELRGSDIRGELGVPQGLPLIGAIGRLHEQKGYDYLIEAVALLKLRGRSLRCLIVGHGPQEQRLRDLITERDVTEEARLIGRRDDVPDVVRALDVAVMPSRWEGSPLAVLEYMGVGAPIVATSVGGVPEMIHDGVHGLLVPAGDPAALANAIERLLVDRELAQRLGAAAQERQRADYDLDVLVGRLQALYVRLYERSAKPSARSR